MKRPIASGAVAAALAFVLGCGSDSLAPFQPEIANLPESFQAQATGVRNVTTTEDWTWQNTSTTANVNQATVVTSGSATLVILDADGTQVYARDLAEDGTFVTAAGASGAWTIRLELARFSGDLNFRVQTP